MKAASCRRKTASPGQSGGSSRPPAGQPHPLQLPVDRDLEEKQSKLEEMEFVHIQLQIQESEIEKLKQKRTTLLLI
jgi:hypothetical protein